MGSQRHSNSNGHEQSDQTRELNRGSPLDYQHSFNNGYWFNNDLNIIVVMGLSPTHGNLGVTGFKKKKGSISVNNVLGAELLGLGCLRSDCLLNSTTYADLPASLDAPHAPVRGNPSDVASVKFTNTANALRRFRVLRTDVDRQRLSRSEMKYFAPQAVLPF